IIFVEPPDFQDHQTVFTTLHEVKHTLQFRDMGELDFMRKYLLVKAQSRNPVSLEIDADHYACSIMPWSMPHYIDSCPLASPSFDIGQARSKFVERSTSGD